MPAVKISPSFGRVVILAAAGCLLGTGLARAAEGWLAEGTVRIQDDDEIAASVGGRSLRLQANSPDDGVIQRRIPVPAEPVAAITGRLKTVDVGRVRAELAFESASGEPLGGVRTSAAFSGTTFEETWESFAVEGRVPPDAAQMVLRVRVTGGGTVWIDELRVQGTDLEDAEAMDAGANESDFTTLAASIRPQMMMDPEEWIVPAPFAWGERALGQSTAVRTRYHFRHAIARFRVSISSRMGGYPAAVGFRESLYGRIPSILWVFQGTGGLMKPVIEDAEGRHWEGEAVPVDGDMHTYEIVRESGHVLFRLDGREIARAQLAGLRLPPMPAMIYNQNSTGRVGVESVDVMIAPAAWSELAQMQPPATVFEEVPYVETTQLAEETKALAERGLILFNRTPIEHLFSNTVPREEEIARPFELAGAPGQTVPLLLGVHSLDAGGPAQVSLNGLKREDGAPLSPHAPEIRLVGEIPKRHLYNRLSNRAYTRLPILLEAGNMFSTYRGRSQGVWVDIEIPVTAQPGMYRGGLTVTTGLGSVTRTVDLRVYPFALAVPSEMFFGAYSTSYDFSLASPGEIVAEIEEVRRNGMTTVANANDWCEIVRTGDDYRVVLNPAFELMVETYRKLGFEHPPFPLRDVARYYAAREVGWGNRGHEEVYDRALRAVHAALSAVGLEDVYLQPLGEPAWKPDEIKRENIDLMRRIKASGLFRTAQDGPADIYFVDEAGPFADVWIVNGQIPDPETVKKAREDGKSIVIYNTDVETWRPVTTRYSAGFFQWKFGLQGLLQWQYQMRRNIEFAYSEASEDLERAYMANYYPRQGGRPGGPTISWRAFREGIMDYRYLLTLEQELEAGIARGSARAARIRAGLEDMRASLESVERLRGRGEWTGEVRNDAGRVLGGFFDLKNGWSLADYDENRRQVAEWIMVLRNERIVPDE